MPGSESSPASFVIMRVNEIRKIPYKSEADMKQKLKSGVSFPDIGRGPDPPVRGARMLRPESNKEVFDENQP
jgi:hypothetical protein